MAIPDVDTPESDGWWLKRLMNKMNARPTKPPTNIADSRRYEFRRRDWLDLLWSYNTGEVPLPAVSEKGARATRAVLRMARANYGMLAVEALMDRVQLAGVRTAADPDADGDDVVRAMIEANGAWLQDTLGYAFAMGQGFAMIGPGEEPGTALITAEDPRQVIIEPDAVGPHVARVALKTYRDEVEGVDVAKVFFRAGEGTGPNNDRDRVRTAKRGKGSATRFTPSSWEWDDSDAASGPLEVQGLGVPVVPYTNRLGLGEYEPHLDLLDRINNMIADRLWTAKLQAFRQRALKVAKGVEGIEKQDEDGNNVDLNDLFAADPGALWELPDGIDIWESQVVDLTPVLSSVRDDVREFSAVTRTPLSMFAPEGENQSAAGAESADDGLVFKAEDRTKRMTPPVLRTCRFALAYAGQADRAKGISAIWTPARRLTLEQRGTAATAGKTSGLPLSAILSELWQFPPATVARILAEARAEQAAALFAQIPAPGQQQPGPTAGQAGG